MSKYVTLEEDIPTQVLERLDRMCDVLTYIGENDFAYLPYSHAVKLARAFDRIADICLELSALQQGKDACDLARIKAAQERARKAGRRP